MARTERSKRSTTTGRKERAGAGGVSTKWSASASDEGHSKLEEHRGRQASIGAFLDQCFGEFKSDDPGWWDQRTYLMLVGMVYQKLAAKESKISTNELVRLAKLFAESRRAEARASGRPRPITIPRSLRTAPNGAGGAFAKVVQEVYGVDPGEPPSPGNHVVDPEQSDASP